MHPFKSPRDLLLPLVALSLVALSLFALQSPVAGAAQPKKGTGELINGVPDTGQFLPNSALLARVADRKISILAFRNAFFNSDPRMRPGNDSLGRAEFLSNMIRKEVLGATALSSGLPLSFEDRITLREYQTTLLSNRLFENEVLGVPPISEDSLRKVYSYTLYDVRVRALSYADRQEAEAAHRALSSGKATWEALAARTAPAGGNPPPAAGTWWKFDNVPPYVALQLWPLQPGKTSPVLSGLAGYQILQVTERRPSARPAFQFMRPSIENALNTYTRGIRRRALLQEAKKGMTIHYDSANVKFASGRFFAAVQSDSSARGGIVIDERVPEFAAEDTARTLVSWEGGRVSLGQVLAAFSNLPPAMRPVLNTPELLMDFADVVMLAPRLTELAIERGLDKDPVVLQRVENKREELLVTGMVEDSCFSRISVTPKERRDYYQKHRNSFVTFPEVRVAFIVRDTKVAADSVRVRLEAGEPVAGILRADSLRGESRSGTQVISSESHHPMHRLLFEEMRPGQRQVMGPDREGHWACFQLLAFDPGKPVPYEQVETVIHESIRNLKAEKALQALSERLMKRYPVETHYDRLMSVKLTTPGDDERE